MNEVTGILEQIEEVAAAKGCYVKRTEKHFGNFVGIFYSVLPIGFCGTGREATAYPFAMLTSREGKTRNCQAFRELSKLLTALTA